MQPKESAYVSEKLSKTTRCCKKHGGQSIFLQKEKNRSKKYCTNQPAFKWPKLYFDARVEWMKALEEEIKDQISCKEKRCQMAEIIKNYKNCDESLQRK